MAETIVDLGHRGALDPRVLMRALEKVLPERRTLVVDAGHHLSFTGKYLSAPDATSFSYPHESGAIGTALPVAIGAAAARPTEVTVLTIGDGGLMMALADLETAVRYRLPLLVIVCNDSAFGAELHLMQVEGLPDALARYDNPSFEAVARGLGAEGLTIEDLEDLPKLTARLASLAGPLVVDCKISQDVRAEWVEPFVHATH